MTQHQPYDGPLPDGWSGGAPVTKRWNGDFVHLYRVTRPCKACGSEISLVVSKNALQGFKKNAGLLLKNCPDCRAARKAGGTGSRGGTSRPVVDNPMQPAVEQPQAVVDELETLRMANHTMKEELDGLYATITGLKSRLAQYELPAAMAAAANEYQNKMPWD